MRRLLILVSVFLLLFAMYGFANAVSINYDYAKNGNEFTSPYSGVIVEDFEATDELWSWSGNGAIVLGTDTEASAPFGVYERDASWYVTVPDNVNSPPTVATAVLPGYYNYFGLWWGSVDDYNTLSFYDGNTLVASFTGSAITSPNAANGNQTAPTTNLYVNFLDLPAFNKFSMSSTQYAFEADNIAIGNVPIPGALWLLGSGLVGLLTVRRKFWK